MLVHRNKRDIGFVDFRDKNKKHLLNFTRIRIIQCPKLGNYQSEIFGPLWPLHQTLYVSHLHEASGLKRKF